MGKVKAIKGKRDLIKQQYDELCKQFPGLRLYEDFPGQWVIRGLIAFSASYNNVEIEDEYSIHIILPEDYPALPPDVQETGGRIPADFHQYEDRTLCLGAPAEVTRRFREDPRLLTFIKTLVIEYLYGYSYYDKYGQMPFGELSHGGPGIREYYLELFNTNDVRIILALLKIMADGSYRGHHYCLCGSGKILRKCHGLIILGLLKTQRNDQFYNDAMYILNSLLTGELEALNGDCIPKQFKRHLEALRREDIKQIKKYVTNQWEYVPQNIN